MPPIKYPNNNQQNLVPQNNNKNNNQQNLAPQNNNQQTLATQVNNQNKNTARPIECSGFCC